MRPSLTSIMLFLSFQVVYGQDDWIFKLLQQSENQVQREHFKLPFTHNDPVEKIKAIQSFNEDAKNPPRSEEKFRLDSTIQLRPVDLTGYTTIVRHYRYNDQGKISTNTMTLITLEGDTAGIFREDFVYNELYQLSQYYLWVFSANNGYWLNWNRLYYTYDTLGLVDSYISYYTDGTTLLHGDSVIITYNSALLPKLVLGHEWEESTSTWDESFKEEYTYSPFKNLLSFVKSSKSNAGSPWEYSSKLEYTYGQGLLLNRTFSYWENNTWIKSTRIEFDYDDNGMLIQQSNKIWIAEGFLWEDDKSFIFEYNAQGQRISARNRRWFQDGHEWILGDSISYEYNLFGDTNTIMLYPWVNSPGPEDLKGWGRYYYNTGIAFSDITQWPLSYWNSLPVTFNNMITGSLLVDLGYYDMADSVVYFYTVITAATDLLPEQIVIYPNPADDKLQFNIPGLNANATLKFFSLSGSLALSTNLDASHIADVSHLTQGMYLYEIRNGQQVFTGKVVIHH